MKHPLSKIAGTSPAGLSGLSSKSLELLLARVDDVVFRWRIKAPEGLEYVSAAVERIFGWAPDAFYENSELLLSLIPPAEMLRLSSQEGASPFGRPFTLQTKSRDGRALWTEIVQVPVFGEAGDIVAIEGIARDITASKQAAAALRESEDLFTKAFHASPLFKSITNLVDGRFVAINHAYLEILGFSREHVIGKTAEELGIWATAVDRIEFIEHLRKVGRIRDFECDLNLPTGEVRHHLLAFDLVVHGGVECLLATGQDQTEKKVAGIALASQTEALAKQNRQLSLIQEINRAISRNMPLSELWIILLDNLGLLVDFDRLELFKFEGRGTVQVVEAWPEERITKGHRLEFPESFQEGIIASNGPIVMGTEGIRKISPALIDQGMRKMAFFPLWFDETCFGTLSLLSKSDEAFSVAQQDLVEMVAAQVAVSLSNAESVRKLRELAAMRAEFVATASHELRTPLAVMKGYIKMLRLPGFTFEADEVREYIGRVDEACDRLNDLVKALLDLSAVDGGSPHLKITSVDLAEVAAEAVFLVGARNPDRLPAVPTNETVALADGKRVLQVLVNLLDNALKYSLPGTTPIIRLVRPEPGLVRVEVENAGVPFSDTELEGLFQRFGRLPRHSALPGTGLGLALSMAYIEHMDGKMGVSNAQASVVFWFELPEGA